MSLTVPDFSSVKTLVAGDLMLDQYWFGPTSRISPEAPVPVVKVTQSQARAGGAANVAVNLASLGAQTMLTGVVGHDASGAALRQLLEQRGIGLDLVESDRPTITKLRVLSRNQQLIRLDTEDAFGPGDARGLLALLRRHLGAAAVCVLSDYAKGSLLEAPALVRACREQKVPVLVDPKGTEFSRYRGATLMTPNLAEFEAVAGRAGAGLVVRKIGVASVTPSELRLELHERGNGGRGLLRREAARRVADEARGRGERIVMTNGCFDILHAGHVAYLEEAKTRGDRLLVAVNDDDSVRRLKGAGRPINCLEDRMAVLAGLAAVDWVVPFAEDTPEQLIGEILPQVLVKGGDYRPEDIAGGATVIANGGTVEVLTFREGRSTSRILDVIRKKT